MSGIGRRRTHHDERCGDGERLMRKTRRQRVEGKDHRADDEHGELGSSEVAVPPAVGEMYHFADQGVAIIVRRTVNHR